MNKELKKKLEDTFSFMKKRKSREEQLSEKVISDLYSAYGLECGDGWYNLIFDLCTNIAKLYEEYKLPIDLHLSLIHI